MNAGRIDGLGVVAAGIGLLAALILTTVPAVAQGAPQDREDVLFQITHFVPDTTRSVFVLGDLQELGAAYVTRAVKLQSDDQTNWQVTISLPVNRDYVYQFVERSHNRSYIGRPRNAVYLGPRIEASTSKVVLKPSKKTYVFHTTIDQPWLVWRLDGETQDHKAVLAAFGPGRSPGESRYIAPSFCDVRREVEFYLVSADGRERDPPSGSYRTRLDQALLQDGALYSYIPDAAVAPARRDYDPLNPPTLSSTVLGVEREYRVYLPRGYDHSPDRRYPVLYQYDGQVLWDFSGGAVGTWDPDGILMSGLVDAGLSGEVIQVGIDNPGGSSCALMEDRFRDCGSPEDTITYCTAPITGEADSFLDFMVNELKPQIDASYRTLPDREHTFAQGFSFGGILALYAGWEHTDTFGAIASQSGSFWVPNFPARVGGEPWRDLRIYLDSGTSGYAEKDVYSSTLVLRDALVGKNIPYVEEGMLRYFVGFGHDHSFTKSGKRMEQVMTFLYPATAEDPGVFLGERYCDALPNSTGQCAAIYAEGSQLASSDDVKLTAIRLPPNVLGVFFAGTAPTHLPNLGGGLGTQCASGNLVRFAGVRSSAEGVLMDTPSIAGLAGPGTTLYFQAWFRDGATSNTSDAVRIRFE